MFGKPSHESIAAGLRHVRDSAEWEACLNIDIADGPMLQYVPADGDLNIAGGDEDLRDDLVDGYATEVIDDGLGYTVISLDATGRDTLAVLEDIAMEARGDRDITITSQTVFHDGESLREQFSAVVRRALGRAPA